MIKLETENFIAKLIPFGATLTAFIVKAKGLDIVAGFSAEEAYPSQNTAYFGSVIGRVCNRIEDGKLKLNGRTYTLPLNNGPNSLHGGFNGFDKRIFKVASISPKCATFEYLSMDGEEGYPGDIQVNVLYTLTDDGLRIEYTAKLLCPETCESIVNLTNHSYFNLDGFREGTILNHRLEIPECSIMALNASQIPTGALTRVTSGSPFWFGESLPIGSRFNDVQVQEFKGYDHFYLIKQAQQREFRRVATIQSRSLRMSVFTDATGFQLYTGNGLDGSIPMKESQKSVLEKLKNKGMYEQYSSFCIETSEPPNAINCEQFKHLVTLNKEKRSYTQTTEYKIETI